MLRYVHKDDCLLYPLDCELKQMIDDVTRHKDIVCEKLGWEFVSQTTLRQAPIVAGGVGMLVWVVSFRQPVEYQGKTEADIPIEQIPLPGA